MDIIHCNSLLSFITMEYCLLQFYIFVQNPTHDVNLVNIKLLYIVPADFHAYLNINCA